MPSSTDSRRLADQRYSVEPDDQLALVRDDLYTRLRAVCAGMSATEFGALVEGMARRAVRWSRASGDEAHLPPA